MLHTLGHKSTHTNIIMWQWFSEFSRNDTYDICFKCRYQGPALRVRMRYDFGHMNLQFYQAP